MIFSSIEPQGYPLHHENCDSLGKACLKIHERSMQSFILFSVPIKGLPNKVACSIEWDCLMWSNDMLHASEEQPRAHGWPSGMRYTLGGLPFPQTLLVDGQKL